MFLRLETFTPVGLPLEFPEKRRVVENITERITTI